MRAHLCGFAVVLTVLGTVPTAHAGLYYSGETIAELPSQWRGYLLDQRILRGIAVKPAAGATASPARLRYEEAAVKLAKTAKERALTADEAADLGALYLRLGESGKALEVLRPAQREHPEHFHLTANLGTAWQMQGDLKQAAVYLKEAVALAPGRVQKVEELHLKLVKLRAKEEKNAQGLDALFDAQFIGPDGKFEAAKLAPEQRKGLPADAVAQVQQLGIWLPADARVLWLLAELANAHGDVATAAAIMDGCVTEFGLRSPELAAHRKIVRAAADERAANANNPDKSTHETGHAGSVKTKSSRPLANKIDEAPLPAIDAKGVNALPWSVVTETTVDRHYKPTFPKYLKQLDGLTVQLSGFMQPLGDDVECGSFLVIEYPVGCWYCEMPEITAMVLVELPEGKTRTYTRGPMKVTGKLKLNATDPENFLYTVKDAKVLGGE
jgi:Tfp pilus assembly protein PilF